MKATMTNQNIIPKPQIPCTPGLCLVYVRETFGIGPKYPTATAGWVASKFKHKDQNFPSNVWVPLWFSLSDNPDGHVALRQPDGSVWSASSPTSHSPVHHPSLSSLLSYYKNRLTYLGWTEDIEDVRVLNVTKVFETSDTFGDIAPGVSTVPDPATAAIPENKYRYRKQVDVDKGFVVYRPAAKATSDTA